MIYITVRTDPFEYAQRAYAGSMCARDCALGRRCSQRAMSHVFKMDDFESAYRQHVAAVFRFAVQYVGRRDIAEDITSDAFLTLYRNFEGLDPDQLVGWLITVVRNRARDYWRHREVEQRHADSLATQPRQEERSLPEFLHECTELKPVHRVCLVMRYVHGMTLKEIAQQTGQSITQIKGHLQYGRHLLRTHYAKSEQ